MKAEIDAMPKAQRKDLYRMRKDQLDRDQMRRVGLSILFYFVTVIYVY